MSKVAGQIQPNFSFGQSFTAGALAGQTISPSIGSLLSRLANGTAAADVIDLMAVVQISLAATTTTIDLTTLTDIVGASVNLANVKLMVWANYATAAGYVLTVGNSGTNEWDAFTSASGTFVVPPSTAGNPFGGFVIVSCPQGLAVSGTHKTIKVDSGANTVTGAVFFLGASS